MRAYKSGAPSICFCPVLLVVVTLRKNTNIPVVFATVAPTIIPFGNARRGNVVCFHFKLVLFLTGLSFNLMYYKDNGPGPWTSGLRAGSEMAGCFEKWDTEAK